MNQMEKVPSTDREHEMRAEPVPDSMGAARSITYVTHNARQEQGDGKVRFKEYREKMK